MKRTFAKQGLMSLLAGFFLFGCLMLTAGNVAAQQLNWYQSDQAKQILVDEVTDLHNAIPGLTGIALENAYIQVSYYKAIFTRIDGGMSTSEAALDALTIFEGAGAQGFARSAPPSDVTIPVTKNMLSTLYQGAEGILTYL